MPTGDRDIGLDATAAPPDAADGTLSVSDSEAEAAAARAHAIATGAESLPVVDRAAYDVSGELARGGLGRILRARDLRLDRAVALKETLRASPDLAARFVREALVTARLQHPAIVPVYEAGRWPTGEPFYAMKLVTGRPLDAVIREATTLERRLALLPNVLAVAEALAYAHQARIIHRDLKPQNVLVGSFGETVVIDWGLAKDLGEPGGDQGDGPYRAIAAPGETVAGAVMGTPAFMPPEQARGDTVDERADVYALGAILYHALAGDPPYTGKTSQEILDRVIREPPPPLERRVPGVPADLAAIVAKAMARSPVDRYRTAGEMAEELRRFQTGQLVGAHRYTTWALLRRWLRRHRAAVGVAAAALAVLAVLSAVGIWRIIRERNRAEAGEAAAEQRRAEAEQVTAVARERLSRQYEEQGRQHFLAGDPARALVYLAEAYQIGDRSSLRFLLAQALPHLRASNVLTMTPGGWVRAARYTPDGRRVLTVAAPDRDPMSDRPDEVAVWDAATGRKQLVLSGTVGRLKDVVPSPDGGLALVSRLVEDHIEGRDGSHRPHWNTEVGIHELRTGTRLHVLSAPGMVDVTAWADQGRRVVAATNEAGAVVWDARTGAEQARFPAQVVAVSTDGARLYLFDRGAARIVETSTLRPASSWKDPHAVGSARFIDEDVYTYVRDGQEIHVWSWTGDHRGPFRGGLGRPMAAGHRMVASNDRDLAIWPKYLVSLEPDVKFTAHAAPITGIAIDPTGTFVASASQDGAAAIWDMETGRLRSRLDGHRDWIETVALSPDGLHLLTASRDGTARIWSLPRQPTFIDAGPDVMGLLRAYAFAPDGRSIAVAAGDEPVTLWSTASGEKLRELAGAGAVHAVAWSPDGKRLMTASNPESTPLHAGDGTVRVWDASTGAMANRIDGLAGPIAYAGWSRPGPLVITDDQKGTVEVWHLEPVSRAGFGGRLRAVSVDGESMAIQDGERLRVIAHDGTPRAAIATGAGTPLTATFSADGSRLMLVSGKTGRIVDATDGRALAQIDDDSLGRIPAVFSPDGRRLATATRNGARIWDSASGRLVLSIDGHLDAVVGLSYSADGGRLATASQDDTAKLWDASNGALLATLGKHEHWVIDARFSPDGTWLGAEVMGRSQVRLWDVRLESRGAGPVMALVRCRVPLRLVEGVPLPAATDPAACAAATAP